MQIEDVEALRDEISMWHTKNYPTDFADTALLSVNEELGELCRAEIKQFAKIRGTFEEWDKEKRKELGDVVISLFNFCFRAKIDIVPIFVDSREFNILSGINLQLLLRATSRLGIVISYYLESLSDTCDCGNCLNLIQNGNIGVFLKTLRLYAAQNNFDFEQCFIDRWATISQRDFIVNPLTGGREKEQ